MKLTSRWCWNAREYAQLRAKSIKNKRRLKKKVDLLEKEVCGLKEKIETMEKEKIATKTTKKKRMTGTEKAKRRKQKAKEMAADQIISNKLCIEPPLSPIL